MSKEKERDWMKEGRFKPTLEAMDIQMQRFERREAELRSKLAYHAKKANDIQTILNLRKYNKGELDE